jgi:diguanylate cyclase (GGDEF)-like protein
MPNHRSELHVLLLSREPDRTETLRGWLDAAHFTITMTVPGDIGLARAEREQPDAIVLHVSVPGPEALALCAELRDAAPTHMTPLLLWSEQPFTYDERLAALRAGAWDCLAPGTDRDEMLPRLHTFVRATRAAERAASDGLVDPLTGLYNRHGLARRARELNSQAFRDHSALACVAFSLDITDASAADEARTAAVVARCAQALSTRSRLSDVIGRLGPKEFAVLAPATGPDGAVKLAHRMLQWVTNALAADPQAPPVRVRAGYDAVVNVAYEPLDPTALLLRAATALRHVRGEVGGDWLRRFEEIGARRPPP